MLNLKLTLRKQGKYYGDWMLVILMDDQILTPQHVCQSCLLADQSGQPRWRQGQLWCGQAIRKLAPTQPDQYQCQMGFRIAKIGE